MRGQWGRRWRLHTSVTAVVLASAACAPAPGTGPSPVGPDAGAAASGTVVAPYVDVTYPSRPAMAEVAAATGQKTFVLAFVLAGEGGCDPSWGGILPLRDPDLTAEVAALQAVGGEVIVATGGADGPYLENACGNAGELADGYRAALDSVGGNRLDVDIEADVPVELVTEALVELQRERGTAVTYTLEVENAAQGVTESALQLLRSAAARDLDVTVNAMVMNFGHTGAWGAAMIDAADATVEQLRTVWPQDTDEQLYSRLGLTPMIGRNDTGMVTTLDDARAVASYARTHRIGYLGFWSLSRDNGGCPGRSDAVSACSGVEQSPYEFTALFQSLERL